MHVAVDAHNLLIDRRGIGVYLRALLTRMLRTGDLTITLLLKDFWPIRLRAAIARELGSDAFRIAGKIPRDTDVVWHPWNGTFFATGNVPSIVTMHDVTPFAYPAADPATRHNQQAPFLRSARARRIITDSQFSKTEIIRHLGVASTTIDVVPLAADRRFAEAGDDGATQARQLCLIQLQGRPYILAVGANDARKNLTTLAEAHRRAFPERDVALVCVGNDAPNGAVECRNCSFEELRALYRGAVAFAMPSIYEGFGIPPLEAMLSDTPAVVSRAASLPEVCGDAALYVDDPMNVDAWTTALQRIASDASLREELRTRGRPQAQKFSWDRTTTETLDILRIAGKGHEP